MQLDQALREISDIRRQMARSGVFRGYRSVPVAFSGLAGLLGAAVQPRWVPTPELQLGRYLGLWLGIAAAGVFVAAIEMAWRIRGNESELARRQTLFAVEHFLPTIVVGALLTFTIAGGAPQVAWMLPGLWSLVFGLGVFASARVLPRPVLVVAAYYVVCGCGCLLWGQGENAFDPRQMGVCFGGGQLLGAVVLYSTLERGDGSAQIE